MSDSMLNKLRLRVESAMDRPGKASTLSFEWGLEKMAYLYELGVSSRFWLYEKKLIRPRELPCFVVSIGNVVAGGAGKTPMTIYLAELLLKMGKKPVVLSRGYKGTYREESLIVSDGTRIFSRPEICGDEPYMMAVKRKFPVVVGRDRALAGKWAVKTLKPDVIILDDGFQHIKLKRDLDLLLLDCSRPFGNGKLLPAGRLREPLSKAAGRAGAVLFTRCGKSGPAEHENAMKPFSLLPKFRTAHEPFVLRPIPSGENQLEESAGQEEIKGKRVLLFSGVADNRSVYRTVEGFGANIVEHLEFQDHYRYKDADFEMINRSANQHKAELIMTTEKDWTKVGSFGGWSAAVLVAGIRIKFEAPDEFLTFIEKHIPEE